MGRITVYLVIPTRSFFLSQKDQSYTLTNVLTYTPGPEYVRTPISVFQNRQKSMWRLQKDNIPIYKPAVGSLQLADGIISPVNRNALVWSPASNSSTAWIWVSDDPDLCTSTPYIQSSTCIQGYIRNFYPEFNVHILCAEYFFCSWICSIGCTILPYLWMCIQTHTHVC